MYYMNIPILYSLAFILKHYKQKKKKISNKLVNCALNKPILRFNHGKFGVNKLKFLSFCIYIIFNIVDLLSEIIALETELLNRI